MGNFSIKNKTVRCEKCFCVRRITIDPKYPFSELQIECRCGGTVLNIHHYLSELGKGDLYKIICHKCRKAEKICLYCNDCKCFYCDYCIKDHNIQYVEYHHKLISPQKFDFYCIFHQNDLYCSYCFNCEENICANCIKENKHQDHRVVSFKNLCLSKTGKEKFEEGWKLIKEKLEYNTKVSNLILKKQKNKLMIKKINVALENNLRENKAIIEMLKYLIYVFNNSKNKNYNIIYNFVENINFNVIRLKFKKDTTIEEDTDALIKYLNSDLVLLENKNNSILDNSKIRGINESKDDLFDSFENDDKRSSVANSTAFKSCLEISGIENSQ